MFGSAYEGKTDYSALLVEPPRNTTFLESTRSDGPDDQALSAFMRQTAFQLGVDGLMLAMHEQSSGLSTTLYAYGACLEEDELRVHLYGESMGVAASGICPNRGSVAAASWSKLNVGFEEWTIAALPILVGSHYSFSIWAVFEEMEETRKRKLGPLAESLSPLLAGFLQLWSERAALHHRVDGLASALNQSDVGILLLDKKRQVIFTNSVADRLLDTGKGLRRTGASISATDLGDALRLQVAIDFSMSDKSAQPCQNAPVVAIKRGETLRPLMVSVLPPDRSAMHDEDAAVILYIFDPNEDVTHLLHPVCKLYRLSPVEAKLASLLTNGASLCEAAKEMRVKEQTARTYLKQIFLKTDTNRQAELVRLMLCSIVRTVHGAKLQVV